MVRFSDIGYAELGPADIKSYMKMNGVPMVGVVVIPQPGANHIEIADAVYQRMEQMKKDLPDDVKYSLWLCPIVFMDGMTGRLFREFSIVVSGSVIISSFAALTFTPMLATKLLVKQEKKNWFYMKTEPFFRRNELHLYSRSLEIFLHKRWLAMPLILATLIIIVFLWNAIPAEMAPLEDRSQNQYQYTWSRGCKPMNTYEIIRKTSTSW